MTIKDVAQVLLNRKNGAYSFILDGATRAKLTPEGFEYARHHGWIELDESTSCMRICMRQVKINEIKDAAAAATSPSISAAAVVTKSSGHELSMDHVCEMNRSTNADTVISTKVVESAAAPKIEGNSNWRDFMPFAGATCHGRAALDEYNPTTPGAPIPTAAPPSNPGTQQDNYEVGDAVQIAEDGKTYQATVQAKQADGSLVLSFGAQKPSKMKPSYQKQEISRIDAQPGAAPKPNGQAPAPAQPSSPAPGMTVGPGAPGIGH